MVTGWSAPWGMRRNVGEPAVAIAGHEMFEQDARERFDRATEFVTVAALDRAANAGVVGGLDPGFGVVVPLFRVGHRLLAAGRAGEPGQLQFVYCAPEVSIQCGMRVDQRVGSLHFFEHHLLIDERQQVGPKQNPVPAQRLLMRLTPSGKALWTSWWACKARPCCLRWLAHWVRRPASRAACTAGKSRAIRTPMMAITTSISTSVKPRRRSRRSCFRWVILSPFLCPANEAPLLESVMIEHLLVVTVGQAVEGEQIEFPREEVHRAVREDDLRAARMGGMDGHLSTSHKRAVAGRVVDAHRVQHRYQAARTCWTPVGTARSVRKVLCRTAAFFSSLGVIAPVRGLGDHHRLRSSILDHLDADRLVGSVEVRGKPHWSTRICRHRGPPRPGRRRTL